MKKILLTLLLGLSSASALAQDCNCDKVTKTVFQADQQRQDAAMAAAVSQQSERDSGQDRHINAVQDAAQSGNIKADQLAVRADGIEKQAGILDGRVGKTEVRLDNVEQVNSSQNQHINAVQDAAESGNIKADQLAVRADGIDKTNAKQETRLNAHQSDIEYLYGETSSQAQSLELSNRNIAANKASLASTNRVVSAHSAQLANHEQRLSNLEKDSASRFNSIDKRLDGIDRHIDAGLSGVSAMANIPQVTENQTFAVGAGVGARGGESAVAVGFSARASQAVVVKASVAGDSQQKWTVGGGLSYGW